MTCYLILFLAAKLTLRLLLSTIIPEDESPNPGDLGSEMFAEEVLLFRQDFNKDEAGAGAFL